MRIILPREAPRWMADIFRNIERAFREPFDAPVRLMIFTVAELPDAADWKGGLVYVSNEAGGAQPAFSDGTNWRRVIDRAIVS